MDKENFFNNTHAYALSFPHDFPYEFASHYSTESESEDEDVARLTCRFSRSASLKESLYDFKEKRVLSSSPESTLGWSGCIPSQVTSPQPFLKGDEDAWNLIYAAAGQVARMKMRMDISNGGVGLVASKNSKGLLGASRPVAHSHCTPWGRADGEKFFRQQQFCQNRGVYGEDNCVGGGCCGGRGAPPPSFPQAAWPPPQLQNLRLQQHRQNQHKPVVLGGSGGACDGGGGVAMAAKRECAGTGVFLPRRYCNNPPESRKGQACSPPHLPTRADQSSNKTFTSYTTPPPHIQARINGCFISNYETLMGRRDAVILAAQQQRRSNIHGGVMVSPVNNPEMLLPQEWTY